MGKNEKDRERIRETKRRKEEDKSEKREKKGRERIAIETKLWYKI